MSELMNARETGRDFRWQLLTTVSAAALLAVVYGSNKAKADDQDADRPTVWIELGGGMERVSGQGDNFPVGFLAANKSSSVLHPTSPLQAQNPPPFSFAEEGKISFQPEDSNWVFSASVNYGRSNNSKEVDNQTNKLIYVGYRSGHPTPTQNPRGIDKFADTLTHHRASHAILDFSVGKEVGLGMFGGNSSSVLSLGVRFAQFASKMSFEVRARPSIQMKYFVVPSSIPSLHGTFHFPYFHTYHGVGQASRSFHGVGPSLSWNGSTPFLGNQQDGEATVDWGANAALLFGRQKAKVQHQASAHYVTWQFPFNGHYFTGYPAVPRGHDSTRSVTVPNLGGSLGLSFRYSNAKLSLGYRADLFFGAVDGGIDTRKSETLGFYGPFASISIGIGG
jgi:iron complex outermembrane receptor protein